MKYSFSGHETFTCRNYWLKKGLDHYWSDGAFDNEAIRELGVGKNMVGAIKYWLKSFGLIDSSETNTKIAHLIFDTTVGSDPYLEDIGTIWLLHFMLVSTEKASIYHLIFNYFRKTRIEFNKDQILFFLESTCKSEGGSYNLNSLKKDINVFLNSYMIPLTSKSIENDFMGLLYELDLIDRVRKEGNLQTYKIENRMRMTLSCEVILVCILMTEGTGTITFNQLLNGINSVGSVFALSSQSLMNSINQLITKYPNEITYKEDAGVQVLQIDEDVDLYEVLKNYYAS